MITKKAKYGLLAMIHLARQEPSATVLISTMAKKEGIPRKFLELILLELKRQGILRSKRGKGGGYSLARPAELIRVGTLLRILDGPLAPLPCVSETAYAPCDECKDEKNCGIRAVMKEARDSIALILDNTTLADIAETKRRARARIE
jgi:Rrf2 family protein